MNNDTLKQYVYAVLGALAEMDSGTPESMVYIALGMDMDAYETVRDVCRNAGWVTISDGNYIELTSDGREIGTAINAALANK